MSDLGDGGSVRTEGDSWEITESVGATALAVAAFRAVATGAADPLIRDPFASLLVAPAGAAWARLANPDLSWLDDDEQGRRAHQLFCDYHAVRTHFFDEYFHAAVGAGIWQVVILAAGLDARAYRLDWPAGTTVYEIDLPEVLRYKTGVLESAGAVPTATWHSVPADLRADWPAALSAAGFDRTRPAAWLAEGLLPYLSAEAEGRLFEMITALSATGSQIGVEAFSLGPGDDERCRAARRARWANTRQRLGLEIDVETLTYQEPDRADATRLLTDRGWQVHAATCADEMARLGRPIPQDLAPVVYGSKLVRARLIHGN
ncbi:MAG: class I SAM-dependent methyltransferase [Mycobacterium sp.]|nr:class I SAM-dependent methyltransferase [Mycobacterium sp.]